MSPALPLLSADSCSPEATTFNSCLLLLLLPISAFLNNKLIPWFLDFCCSDVTYGPSTINEDLVIVFHPLMRTKPSLASPSQIENLQINIQSLNYDFVEYYKYISLLYNIFPRGIKNCLVLCSMVFQRLSLMHPEILTGQVASQCHISPRSLRPACTGVLQACSTLLPWVIFLHLPLGNLSGLWMSPLCPHLVTSFLVSSYLVG